MEPSGPNATSSRRAAGSPAEREALAFLGREIQPALRSPAHRALAEAVRAAVGSGSVASLGHLAERQRRELLETIEARLGRGRPAPSARALVRLTTVIAAAPEQFEPRAPPAASPAR